MRHLLLWSHHHSPWAVLVLVVGTVLAVWFARAVQIDTSLKALMVEDDPAVADYQETCDRFGIDSVTVVYLGSPDLFTPERLTALGQLTEELQSVPGVDRVESLATVADLRNRDGLLHTGPLLDWPVESIAAAVRVRDDARRNPLIARTLVSPDHPVTAVNVYLNTAAQDPRFVLRIHDEIEALLAPYRPQFAEVFQIGTPFRIAAERASILRDQQIQIPAAILVLVVVLIAATQSPRAALLPLLTAGVSIAWTLGFMGLAGIPITVLTFMIPSLILVIGSTEDIHITSEYLDARRRGLDPAAAVVAMADEIGSALTFTAATTCLGFIAIAFSPLTGLKEFGYVAGFGLFANPVVTALLSPLYLRRFVGGGPRPPAVSPT
ncbi:MMPL family transporter, partial [bacterium]|nr:MMPL family transporter [bacterium]